MVSQNHEKRSCFGRQREKIWNSFEVKLGQITKYVFKSDNKTQIIIYSSTLDELDFIVWL